MDTGVSVSCNVPPRTDVWHEVSAATNRSEIMLALWIFIYNWPSYAGVVLWEKTFIPAKVIPR